MNCPDVKNRLGVFLAGALSGDEASQVRSHLAACPRCLSALPSVHRLEILPAFDQGIEPSEDLCHRFHERLIAHRRRVPWTRGSLFRVRVMALLGVAPGQVAAVGALAAFLLIGVWLGLYRVPAPARDPGHEIPIAENLPILQDLGVIKNLDLLEDFDAIEDLSGEEPAAVPTK